MHDYSVGGVVGGWDDGVRFDPSLYIIKRAVPDQVGYCHVNAAAAGGTLTLVASANASA